MKQLLVMLISLGLTMGASAQVHGRGGGGIRNSAPRITYVVPRASLGLYSPYYPSFGMGYGYGFGYSPFYGSGMFNSSRPSRLDLQVEDIKNDYKDRIWSAKHATELSRTERKAKVQELKHDREAAIIDAKRDYYKTDRHS